MTTLYTTGQVAARIGRAKSSVVRAARRLGLPESPLGFLFCEEDLARISAEIKPIGCPKFSKGNELWKNRKKRRKSAPKRR